MSPGRGDGPHRPMEFFVPKMETNRSDEPEAHPYHDLSLLVLGVRSKRRSRFRGRRCRHTALVVKA